MINVEYLVLGGGVSGLTFAASLLKQGVDSVLVLEKESEVGGLCRSKQVDGFDIDIGGGHFLDVRNQTVLDFVFQFMSEDQWSKYSRISKISTRYKTIDYPYEANIWQFPVDVQVEYLKSIAQAGCNTGEPMPEKFSEWIDWKLGNKVSEDYMLPYNKKIFDMDLDALGTYWLYKLPDVSFEDTLRSCLERKPAGKIPAHGEFYYPKKHGYGQLWLNIGAYLGNKVLTDFKINTVDFNNKVVNGEIKAKVIINTIPWREFVGKGELPEQILDDIHSLRYSGIDVDYYSKTLDTDAHWIYEPDVKRTYHRQLCRSNFLKGSPGYWTETNTSRNVDNDSEYRYTNEYAYPINTIQKPETIKRIIDWAKTKDVLALGRWGEWEHMNSDVAVSKALALADTIIKESAK